MNIVPAEYHRKHFTPSYHIAGQKDGFTRSLCGRKWPSNYNEAVTHEPGTKAPKPQCNRCYSAWKRRSHHGEMHPAFGLPEEGNAMLHAVKVRPLNA